MIGTKEDMEARAIEIEHETEHETEYETTTNNEKGSKLYNIFHYSWN